jgi:hypothetical protein
MVFPVCGILYLSDSLGGFLGVSLEVEMIITYTSRAPRATKMIREMIFGFYSDSTLDWSFEA